MIAYILEGRHNKDGRRRRSNGAEYKQLNNVEEALPSPEKVETAKNYMY